MGGWRKKRWQDVQTFFAENSLSIVLLILFVGFLIAQCFSGLSPYNDTRSEHGLGQVG